MKVVGFNDSVSTLVFASLAALPLAGAWAGGPVVATLCATVAAAFLLSELIGPGIDRDYVWIRWSAISASSLVLVVALYRFVVWVASRPDVLVVSGVAVVVILGIAAAFRNLFTHDRLVSEYADHEDSDVR